MNGLNGQPAVRLCDLELAALAAKIPARSEPAPSSATEADSIALKKLTKAVCRGDEAAFTQFYHSCSFRLYKYLLGLSKGNELEAAEVMQLVAIKLAKRFQVFEEEDRMWRWLYRLAHNAFLDHLRARGRQQRFVPLNPHHADSLTEESPGNGWDLHLRAALGELTSEETELLREAYVDGRPLKELARRSRPNLQSAGIASRAAASQIKNQHPESFAP